VTESEEGKLFRLATLLANKTRKGIIGWEAADSFFEDYETYAYSTASSTVLVGEDGPRRWIKLVVKNSDGQVLSTLPVTERTSEEFDDVLYGLFDAARRSVLKIDVTLDAIISDLEEE